MERYLNFEQEFYKTLFKSLENNAVLRKKGEDGQYVPIYCTYDFARMMQCSPEAFIQKETEDPLCTVHPEDRNTAAHLLTHRVDQYGSTHAIIRKITLKGNVIWVDLHYNFFTYNGVDYAYSDYFDVSQLKENEHRLEVMYEAASKEVKTQADSSLSTLKYNLVTGVIENISGYDLFDCDHIGASVATVTERRIQSITSQTDRQKYKEYFTLDHILGKFYKGEDLEPLVLFSERQSGLKAFVKYTSLVRIDPDTKQPYVYSIETVVNDEKVNEILTREILEKQFDMICYIVDGRYGVVIGKKENVIKGNIFPNEMKGSYPKYIETQVLPVVATDHNDREEIAQNLSIQHVQEELRKNDSYVVDLTCDIDQELYYKRFTFYRIDNDAKFFVLLKSDITAITKAQVEKNNQLSEALTEAKQANVAKTSFLSRMSHEIRTPMNAIIGLDNIALQEPELPEGIKQYLLQIGSSARYLLGLINDILDMSRIESGKMVLKNEKFNFKEFIYQINTLIGSQCNDQHLNYESSVSGNINEFYIGDSMKLKQVLINILGNSVKFTEANGNVTFRVQCIDHSPQHPISTIKFEIADTGIGIDPSFLPRLFDPFAQEDLSNTNKYGGSGLGLSITKNIIDLMNGKIDVKSEKGKGSTFTVEVVLKNAEGISKQVKNDASANAHIKILVVDDDPISCKHAQITLEEIGISSDISHSGDEALNQIKITNAKNERYDLILVDLRMPNMNGIELTRHIREVIGDLSAIVLLTAYNWSIIEQEAIEAGVDGFMSKPIFATDVLEEFNKAIEKRRIIKEQKTHRSIENIRVLVAEDVEINQKIVKRLLNKRKVEVEVADNGQIALETFSSKPENYYDAILMDIRMPVMDGLQATAAIRKLEREDAKKIPIIAVTANAFDDDVQQSLLVGMNAHLSKPYEPDQLYSILEKLINQ